MPARLHSAVEIGGSIVTPEIAAAVARIASAGTMTPRGVILRLPFPRPAATATVQRMLDTGALVVRADGTVGLSDTPAPVIVRKRKPYSRISRERVIAELKRKPQSSGELADTFRCTKHAAQQHLRALLAEGIICVAGMDKRPRVRGYACRVYAIAEPSNDA